MLELLWLSSASLLSVASAKGPRYLDNSKSEELNNQQLVFWGSQDYGGTSVFK